MALLNMIMSTTDHEHETWRRRPRDHWARRRRRGPRARDNARTIRSDSTKSHSSFHVNWGEHKNTKKYFRSRPPRTTRGYFRGTSLSQGMWTKRFLVSKTKVFFEERRSYVLMSVWTLSLRRRCPHDIFYQVPSVRGYDNTDNS